MGLFTHESESAHARELFIYAHLPLVHRCASELNSLPSLREDIVQVGTIGLINAVDHFDPTRGTSFAAYARPHIRGEILHYFRDDAPPIRVPRPYREICQAIRSNRERVRQSLGHDPSASDLAEALGIPIRDIEAAIQAEAACSVHVMDPEDGQARDHIDVLDEQTALRHAVAQLPLDEQRIIALIYWDGLTQQLVAERIGRSQMHVSRKLRQGLSQLREVLAD